MRKRKSRLRAALGLLLLPAAAAAALLVFASALNSLESGRQTEDLRQLEQALRRGCVACYAAEGAYPPTLDYLQEHYGVQIDGDRYTVHYDVFAENLMPDITILENQP